MASSCEHLHFIVVEHLRIRCSFGIFGPRDHDRGHRACLPILVPPHFIRIRWRCPRQLMSFSLSLSLSYCWFSSLSLSLSLSLLSLLFCPRGCFRASRVSPLPVGYSTSPATQHRRLLNIVGYSTSSVTQHRQPCPQSEIRRLMKKIQDY
jgi:hypothetical protein